MTGTSLTPGQRSALIRRLAHEHAFDRAGIASLGPIPRAEYALDWLRDGLAGTMGYLYRCRETRLNPGRLLSGAKTAIVVAVNYGQPCGTGFQPVRRTQHSAPRTQHSPRGRVAMYAWGEDYHVVMRERLERLLSAIRQEIDQPFDAKICVDTSAIIERELAAAAGIGWIGKNTLVLHQDLGSYFFLGEILTTLDLEPDRPVADHCGRCTRCLDACPTQAFPAPYQMDARRCISYLTIEHRGDIPDELKPRMGDWVFGCDVCQQVCPYNREPPITAESRFAAREPGLFPILNDILGWDDDDYAQQVTGSATDRASLSMWKRNAAIALANAAANEDEPT